MNPLFVSVPSPKNGASLGGLKKNVCIEKIYGKAVGNIKGWFENAEVCFGMFKKALDICVPEAIAALNGPATA